MIAGLPFDLWLKVMVLTLPRLIVMFFIIPIIGHENFPGMLRGTVLAGIALAIAPVTAPAAAAVSFDGPMLLAVLVKEALLGLLLGFPLAVAYWAVQGVGYYIDNQRGAAIADTLDPLTSEQSSALGVLFSQAFIVYFFAAGGFMKLLDYAFQSYALWPVDRLLPPMTDNTLGFFVASFQSLSQVVVILSAPVIIAMFATEIALALVSKFAPQLNVFSLAQPIKSGVSLFVLIAYIPIFFNHLSLVNLTNLDALSALLEKVQ